MLASKRDMNSHEALTTTNTHENTEVKLQACEAHRKSDKNMCIIEVYIYNRIEQRL